ncbi:MAG: hypothetical protein ACXAB7_14980 [Candidatus Kariarchaeaceae archaeon]|jgi:hypothetical protein
MSIIGDTNSISTTKYMHISDQMTLLTNNRIQAQQILDFIMITIAKQLNIDFVNYNIPKGFEVFFCKEVSYNPSNYILRELDEKFIRGFRMLRLFLADKKKLLKEF